MKKENSNKLQLIPKIEKYIEYMLNVLIKIPRTEKFSIDTEYKKSMFMLLEYVMYINIISNSQEILEKLNKIDAELNVQRVFLRIMQNEK